MFFFTTLKHIIDIVVNVAYFIMSSWQGLNGSGMGPESGTLDSGLRAWRVRLMIIYYKTVLGHFRFHFSIDFPPCEDDTAL